MTGLQREFETNLRRHLDALYYAALDLSGNSSDADDIVQETAMLLRNSTEVDDRHDIEVKQSADAVMVEADESQSRHILWNHATHGVRAMPQGGALCLSARHDDRHTHLSEVLQGDGAGPARRSRSLRHTGSADLARR